ncbi:hypothetical protein [Levilactobacillus namurensis]|uniref:DUF4352 domain-containing protein n=1 Tax=Levilactobacillus namurensis TaxID=380393 RepID=A0AAW8W9C0_9LACO|nr:hypothetical protein [Levilactobacillus namurensis]MDT7015378.1 hypothetical protein [Levilactobacillus namurensis]
MKKLVLLSLAALAPLYLAACSDQSSSSSSKSSTGSATSSKVVKKPTISITTSTTDDPKSIAVTSNKMYKSNVSDSSWQGNIFKIDGIKMITTKPFKYHDDDDGIYNSKGVALIKYSIKAVAFDIDGDTNTSNLTTNLGGQTNIDYMDSQDTDTVNKGVTKTGIMIFPLTDNPSSIKSLRLKTSIDANSVKNDSSKDYDLNISLSK